MILTQDSKSKKNEKNYKTEKDEKYRIHMELRFACLGNWEKDISV